MDALLITGIRDEALVATFSPFVPSSKLLEVNITTTALFTCPQTVTFANTSLGPSLAQIFATTHLVTQLSASLHHLGTLARHIPSFPRPGIEFRHVLNIAQHPGGLALCASLMQTHFSGDWAQIATIVCVEAGGFLFASALATNTGVPLALVRGEGRLPPPMVRVGREASHISGISEATL